MDRKELTMTNGGYKILDFNGERIGRTSLGAMLKTEAYTELKKAESSGKPVLITNVVFTTSPGGEGEIDTEITIPVFLNVVKTAEGYAFSLPNGITGTILEGNSITVN